jgi:tRNA threonylcarbamoyladenosine biosynthesis protein TsaE
MEVITKNAAETKRVACEFANTLNPTSPGAWQAKVIALTGDLGSGKTTFMQGFAEGLGITSRLISPTFILMRQYPIQQGKLYHLDVYRLDKNASEEAKDLGLLEIISDHSNIVVIEWAEKIKDILPEDTQWINFEYVEGNRRRIIV